MQPATPPSTPSLTLASGRNNHISQWVTQGIKEAMTGIIADYPYFAISLVMRSMPLVKGQM